MGIRLPLLPEQGQDLKGRQHLEAEGSSPGGATPPSEPVPFLVWELRAGDLRPKSDPGHGPLLTYLPGPFLGALTGEGRAGVLP